MAILPFNKEIIFDNEPSDVELKGCNHLNLRLRFDKFKQIPFIERLWLLLTTTYFVIAYPTLLVLHLLKTFIGMIVYFVLICIEVLLAIPFLLIWLVTGKTMWFKLLEYCDRDLGFSKFFFPE